MTNTNSSFRSWASARAQKALEITDEQRAKAHAEQVAEVAAYRLAEIRKQQSRTQTEVGEAMGVGQRRVSAIESAALGQTELATIAAYVGALGGNLRLVADFGDRTILIEDNFASR